MSDKAGKQAEPSSQPDPFSKVYKHRYGEPVSDACGDGKHGECTQDLTKCHCTFRTGHKVMHAYMNPVAESTSQASTQPPEYRFLELAKKYHDSGQGEMYETYMGLSDFLEYAISEGVVGESISQATKEEWARRIVELKQRLNRKAFPCQPGGSLVVDLNAAEDALDEFVNEVEK